MNYDAIDQALDCWADKHNLSIVKKDGDSEVRSTDVRDFLGNRLYQIWIKLEENHYLVNIWDYKQRKAQYAASLVNITERLEEAYNTAQLWISK